MARKGPKYSNIANDPVVKRWLANVRRGSQVTAGVALRRLGWVCGLLGITPGELLERARHDLMGFQDVLEDMVEDLEAKGKAPSYIAGLLKPVKSLLKYHGVVLSRKITITNANATPTIEDEQIPSQEELSRILRASPPRIKIAEVLLAFADLRPETLGNYDATDGLMLGDLPELKIGGGEVTFEKTPTMIIVRSPLSKARHKYFTFLSGEGCAHLKEYLEGRMRAGERLKPKSPLIGHERRAVKPFVHTGKITGSIRECMRKAGVRKRPYVLRAYAETQLIIAESKGKISHPYLQFIAGHKGDIEARYSTNKGRLPPDMIEGMREAYRRCERFLGTSAQPLEQTGVINEAKLEALKSVAENMFGIKLIDAKIAREKELGRELEPDEEIELLESRMKEFRENPDPQKIVEEGELEAHLAEGWEFVSVLPSRKILIRTEGAVPVKAPPG